MNHSNEDSWVIILGFDSYRSRNLIVTSFDNSSKLVENGLLFFIAISINLFDYWSPWSLINPFKGSIGDFSWLFRRIRQQNITKKSRLLFVFFHMLCFNVNRINRMFSIVILPVIYLFIYFSAWWKKVRKKWPLKHRSGCIFFSCSSSINTRL